MGKKKSSASWFSAVKKAFSPQKSTKTQDQDLDNKKEIKKRWLFRKSSVVVQHQTHDIVSQPKHAVELAAEEEKHAVSVAAAAVKAAEAAATTVHAAAEIIRLTASRPSSTSVKHHFAAILIQTSFRGYLVISLFQISVFLYLNSV